MLSGFCRLRCSGGCRSSSRHTGAADCGEQTVSAHCRRFAAVSAAASKSTRKRAESSDQDDGNSSEEDNSDSNHGGGDDDSDNGNDDDSYDDDGFLQLEINDSTRVKLHSIDEGEIDLSNIIIHKPFIAYKYGTKDNDNLIGTSGNDYIDGQ